MLSRGSGKVSMKERAFRKFVSLIPEGMKARLEPFKNKITEVMRK